MRDTHSVGMHLLPIQTGPGCVCQCLVTDELTCCGFLQSMRMLLSFGVRRHMVHAAPEPSYEAMLALDENNPRRGVKKHILEQLPHVRIPHCPSASLQMPCPALPHMMSSTIAKPRGTGM